MSSPLTNTQSQDEVVPTVFEREQFKLRSIWNTEMGQKATPVKHDRTSMIMLSWDPPDDDLGVGEEVNRLAKLLSDPQHYNFSVVTKTLNTKAQAKPQSQAFKHLAQFVEDHDGDRTLLIVYYAGHAFAEEEHSGASEYGTISLAGSIPGVSIKWLDVERVLSDTRADVFVIFDCCHAGLLCKRAWRDDTRCFEYLGACGPGDRTLGPGPSSFTTAITWAFEQLRTKSEGFNVTELVDYVRQAPNFPALQLPAHYSGRFGISVEHMFLAPMPKRGEASTQIVGEYRDQREEKKQPNACVDLRFFFEETISDVQLQSMAQAMRGWLDKHQRSLKCQEIAFQRSVSKQRRRASHMLRRLAEAVVKHTIPQPLPMSPTESIADPFSALEANLSEVVNETTPLVCSAGQDEELNPGAWYGGSIRQTVGYHLQVAARILWARVKHFCRRLVGQMW